MLKKNHTKIINNDLIESSFFFTWDYSLTTWHESGTITRELKFFKSIEKYKDATFSFITYGDSSDIKLANEHNLHEVHPVYSLQSILKINYLEFFYRF